MATSSLEHSHKGPTLLVASELCRRAGHHLTEAPRGLGADDAIVCVTCTEEWGHRKGLRDWQENCPCCFSAAHPNGLTDLGITAELRMTRAQAAI